VLCEGERTEPEYIRGFQRACKNTRVDVEIAKERGVPHTLVHEAKRRKNDADAAAKRERDENLRYEEVWIAFDVDEHPKVAETLDMAKANGIQVAMSNPCIELWLLLHFRPNPGMQHRHKVQKQLEESVGQSGKGVDFTRYEAQYETALERARRLAADAEKAGEPGRNPTTWFYRLTESIRAAR